MVFISLVFSLILSLFVGLGSTQAAGKRFTDVPANHWASEAIYELTGMGIINGYADGRFGINEKITKAQAAAMLSKSIQLDTKNVKNPGFTDVKSSYWAYGAIAATTNKGMFSKGAKFYPAAFLTRAEMARAMVVGYGLKSTDVYKFKDVPSNHWAYNYISVLAANKVTTGYADNTFRPTDIVTSAQFAKFLFNAIHLNPEIPTNPQPKTPTSPAILGDIALGMSKQEVKDLQTATLVEETKDTLAYERVLVLDLTATVIYEFQNDELIAIDVYHDVVTFADSLELLETYFVVLLEDMMGIYGEPTVIDTDWYDDEDGYSLSAYWQLADHQSLLAVKINYDYSTFGGIRIAINE